MYDGLAFKFHVLQNQETLTTQRRKKIEAPRDILLNNLRQQCSMHDIEWSSDLEKDVAHKWEKHGDLILLPHHSFQREEWDKLGQELWLTVADCLGASRVARKNVISADDFRSPQVRMLRGADGWVEHKDNGIRYRYNIETNMFSAGNVTEKLRVSSFHCEGETVVDLYAGIGYFTLPYLVHAHAAHVHACEWNPHAVAALTNNLHLNGVQQRCTVHAGDNREVCPKGVADRVNLGLIPSSEESWSTACAALKPETGGILHIHANVTSSKDGHQATQALTDSCQSNIDSKKKTYPYKESKQTLSSSGGTKCKPCKNSDSSSSIQSDDLESDDLRTKNCSLLKNIEVTDPDRNDKNSVKQTKFAKKKQAKSEWTEYALNCAKKIKSNLEHTHCSHWNTEVLHIEHVKSYAPHVDHVVIDLKCTPIVE